MKKIKVKKKKEKKTKRKDSVYETNKYVYNFQQYEIIRSIAENIFTGKITLDNVDKDQSVLLNDFIDFNERTNQKIYRKKLKRDIIESLKVLYEGRETVLNAFKS